MDTLKDKRVIILLSVFGVIILGVLTYTVTTYVNVQKEREGYVNMEIMDKSRFTIKQENKGNDWEGKVEFNTPDTKIRIDKYLTKNERDYIQDKTDVPKVTETNQSLGDLVYDYSNITFGKGTTCELDEEEYGNTFKDCMVRTSLLLSNSNKEYEGYVDSGLGTLEYTINKKIELIEKMRYQAVGKDKDVKTAVDYLYQLNLTYLENIKDLKELTDDIGTLTLDEMDMEVVAINNSYQTLDAGFELRLIRYINEYKNIQGE